jgi:hypothetical protein
MHACTLEFLFVFYYVQSCFPPVYPKLYNQTYSKYSQKINFVELIFETKLMTPFLKPPTKGHYMTGSAKRYELSVFFSTSHPPTSCNLFLSNLSHPCIIKKVLSNHAATCGESPSISYVCCGYEILISLLKY